MSEIECFSKIVHPMQLESLCFKLLFSKVVGLLMSTGALAYKVPIISNIMRIKTADGLNLNTVYLEMTGYSAWVFYNFLKGNPLSVYGDLVATAVQQLMIILLIWKYGINRRICSVFHIIVVVCCYAFAVIGLFFLPDDLYHWIARYAVLMTMISKIPQIYSNFIFKQVGVQSPTSLLNGVIGGIAKIIVAFIETTDYMMIFSGVLSFVLNSMLLMQVLYYAPSKKND
jgi:mannose-P-dolichol utilization defect protein 1